MWILVSSNKLNYKCGRRDAPAFQKYIIKIRLLFYIISYVCIFNALKLCYNINNILG